MNNQTLLDLWNLKNDPSLKAKGFSITLRRGVKESSETPAFTSTASVDFDLSDNPLAKFGVYRVPIPYNVPNDEPSIVDYMIRILAGSDSHESH